MCLVAALLMLAKHYLSVKCDLDSKYFDLVTITAGDYTVSLDITEAQCARFKKLFQQQQQERRAKM